jgi:predicted Zn finger-like uncharacterized protein
MPVRLHCPGCKSLYRLPDHLTGKTVRCKGCGEIFKVMDSAAKSPIDEEQTEESTPKPSTAAKLAAIKPSDDDLEDQPEKETVPPQEDEEEPKPSKRRGKPAKSKAGSKRMLFIVGAVLLVAVAVFGPLAWYFWPSGGPAKIGPAQSKQPATGLAAKGATSKTPNKEGKGISKEEPPPTAGISYVKHVQPFLKNYCLKCHGGKMPKAGVDLASFAAIMGGGEDKLSLVVPMEPDKSLIVQVIEGKAKHKMPPQKEKQPNPGQKNMLRTWVEEGATDDSAVKDGTPLDGNNTELLAGRRSEVFYRSWGYSSSNSIGSPTPSTIADESITGASQATSMR